MGKTTGRTDRETDGLVTGQLAAQQPMNDRLDDNGLDVLLDGPSFFMLRISSWRT